MERWRNLDEAMEHRPAPCRGEWWEGWRGRDDGGWVRTGEKRMEVMLGDENNDESGEGTGQKE